MTLAEIRLSVRNKLDDSQYDATLVDEAANWFVNEIFNNNRIRTMEETDTLQIAQGATSAAFPEDFQTLLNLSVTSPAIYTLMDNFMEYGDFIKLYPGFATYTQAAIRNWTDFANGMRFSAPANASHTVFIEYLRRPNTMEDDGDECEIPDAYRKMVTIGTLAEMMERNEDYAEAAQERNKLSPLVTTFIRNEGRGQTKVGPTIMRSNRRGYRAGGYNAARDF
jgi:hypothetical protein